MSGIIKVMALLVLGATVWELGHHFCWWYKRARKGETIAKGE